MRYDAERGKLNITCSEFVSIARRRISSALPYNEDEPSITAASKRELELERGSLEARKLIYDFETDGHAFELVCSPDGVGGGELVYVRSGEFKRGAPIPEFRAQASGEAYICAYVYSALQGADTCRIRIAYLDSASGNKVKTDESVKFEKLTSFFEKCKGTVGIFARPEVERVTKRLPSLKNIRFPYGKMRDGQRELVKNVYHAISAGTRLFTCAPTGTGKTAATLYPALRALGDGRCDKVFYLTPKSTTATAPKELIELMCERGADIRAVVLASKDYSCINSHACREGRKFCDNSKCNKLAEAVMALYDMAKSVVTVTELRAVAKEYSVCPHELELSYAELCDAVICDFNYLFEPTVYIRRFFDEGGNFAFLIDEAHNLPDRAREMYSAELSASEIENRELAQILPEHSSLTEAMASAADELFEILYPYVKEELRDTENGQIGAQHISELPSRLYPLFEVLLGAAEGELLSEYSRRDDEHDIRLKGIREYIRDIKKMYSAMMRFDRSYELFIFFENSEIRFKIFCLDTGKTLSDCVSKGKAAVFFSATLAPMEYYRATLGGERTSGMLEVASPFDPSQLCVSVIDKISTRYLQREETLLAVCRTIAATVSARRGNYMIFSPSFDYSEMLYKAFSAKYPKINVLHQTKDMTYKEKQEFLAKFREDTSSYLIGFCVMGGIYSEGVDLVGDSLIGAVVVGIGIPSVSYEREAMSAYYDERFEAGKQYAYIYPGMNRVFQAAGRVIRHEDDRGVIVLIDDRFSDPIYKKSASDLFRDMRFIPDAKALKETLEAFWRDVDEEKRKNNN